MPVDGSMDPKTECRICGEKAKPNKTFHAHYGVICCLGCKAFFRRIHQEKRDVDKLVCKGDYGTCDITAMRRGKCKKCRYLSCIKNGLRPDQVLNEEERKKFTFRRKGGQRVESLVFDNHEETEFNSELKMAMESLISQYSAVDMDFRMDEDAVKMVISGHLKSNWSISHTEAFLRLIHQQSSFFSEFALQNPYLKSLLSLDQDILIRNNSHLFNFYIMARYMGASNGLDQLIWLLGSRLSLLSLTEIQQLVKVPFSDLNKDGVLIPIEEHKLVASFEHSIQLMQQHFNYPQFYNGAISFFLLFSTRHWSGPECERLHEQQRIHSIGLLARDIVNFGCQSLNIGMLDELVMTLRTMQMIMNEQKSSLLRKVHSFQRFLAHDNETRWVDKKLDIYNDALRTFQMSSSFIQMLIDFNNGDVNIRPQICVLSSNILMKRFQYMISHLLPESKHVGGKQMAWLKVADTNVQSAMFLMFVKSMEMESFKDQLEIMTNDDISHDFPEVDGMPPLTVEKYNGKNPIYKKHQKFQQCQLRRSMKPFTTRKELTTLALYIMILNCPDYMDVINLRQFFLSIMYRKVSNLKEFQGQQPEYVVHDFFESLNAYGALMEKMANEFEPN